jgi:pimeloyl-ACP methyl ester carboxylesterase
VPLRNAEQLADEIPDADLRVFAGRGHLFPLECPTETATVVEQWLARRGFVAVPTP